ncbi:MAG: PTS sugar transporter subunit IIA [Brevinema sp.]
MFRASHIFLNMSFKNKQELFDFIATKAVTSHIAPYKKLIINGLKKREAQSSTLLTYNMAFPHTRNEEISNLTTFLITLKNPIKYHRLKTVKIIFCILAPCSSENEYIINMSKCASITMNKTLLRLIESAPKNKNKEVAHQINDFIKSEYPY